VAHLDAAHGKLPNEFALGPQTGRYTDGIDERKETS
jgi:hypothetical protein